jgi:hypothetical protein
LNLTGTSVGAPFTFVMWLRADSTANAPVLAMDSINLLSISGGKWSYSSLASGDLVIAGSWVFLGLTQDTNGNTTLYTLSNSESTPTVSTAMLAPLSYASRSSITLGNFAGAFAELQYYATALSLSDFSILASKQTNCYVPSPPPPTPPSPSPPPPPFPSPPSPSPPTPPSPGPPSPSPPFPPPPSPPLPPRPPPPPSPFPPSPPPVPAVRDTYACAQITNRYLYGNASGIASINGSTAVLIDSVGGKN